MDFLPAYVCSLRRWTLPEANDAADVYIYGSSVRVTPPPLPGAITHCPCECNAIID